MTIIPPVMECAHNAEKRMRKEILVNKENVANGRLSISTSSWW